MLSSRVSLSQRTFYFFYFSLVETRDFDIYRYRAALLIFFNVFSERKEKDVFAKKKKNLYIKNKREEKPQKASLRAHRVGTNVGREESFHRVRARHNRDSIVLIIDCIYQR